MAARSIPLGESAERHPRAAGAAGIVPKSEVGSLAEAGHGL